MFQIKTTRKREQILHYHRRRSWRTRAEDYAEMFTPKNSVNINLASFYAIKTAKFSSVESKVNALLLLYVRTPAECSANVKIIFQFRKIYSPLPPTTTLLCHFECSAAESRNLLLLNPKIISNFAIAYGCTPCAYILLVKVFR